MSGHALLKHMIQSRICLSGRHVQHEDRFIGWHVMQEYMYYWKTCGSSVHVFYENRCNGRTCLVGGPVLRSVQKLKPLKLL